MFRSRRKNKRGDLGKHRPGSGKRRKSRKGQGQGRGPLFRLFYWSVVGSLWAGLAVAFVGFYVFISLPESQSFKLPEREPGVTIVDAYGQVMARRGAFHGDKVTLRDLPAYLPQAILATEDRRFYNHLGVDPMALGRAFIANAMAGHIVQGGSTITQQLAKNLFLQPDRTLKRKVQEAVLAFWLEGIYTKDEILQLYMNRVYFGAGAYGVDAAARSYFGKSASEVTLREAALLAAVLKAPSYYAPSRHPERAAARAQLVLDRMVDAGFISGLEGKIAEDSPTNIARDRAIGLRQFAVDWVTEQANQLVGEHKGELIVETTIDPRLQDEAEASLSAMMEKLGKARNAHQAALVSLAPDGAVRAMVGGRSYSTSQFNRAVNAMRQPGSAFKPFVFITALERGLTPESVVVDGPVSIKGWQPKNYNNKYMGPVSLRDSLAFSLNTVSARLTASLGAKDVVATAHRLGISSELAANPSISLGTSEVSLIELTSAYAPLSNGGYTAFPYVIHAIKTADGTVLYQRQGSGGGRILDQRTVAYMNDMLSGVISYGTAKAARIGEHPVAGKTGTSQDFRDAWFVGYSAHLTTGVWVGNDDGTPMKKVTGGSLPVSIWHDYMASAHSGMQVASLPGADAPGGGGGFASILQAFGFDGFSGGGGGDGSFEPLPQQRAGGSTMRNIDNRTDATSRFMNER